ncbi:probable methylated-DNA-protein-cysteine methyltransferase [Coccomyxa sp. Obi]|nr:probable methylated-DNA-protein-cysteine methyltransferase [Coccomyxa sp. Obi]
MAKAVARRSPSVEPEPKKRAPTLYEQRLYKVCSAIPKGKVSTYGALAIALKSSPRAVGQALRRNPYAPQVPCHRVVAHDLKIGGFSGTWDPQSGRVNRKKALLESEGVRFVGDKIADDCVADPEILAAAC